ncbi:thiol S-methyltransferase TMT1A-like isoform X2 [Amphiura filiformis]|uniref:thiol S-methyltransferase TMT1A-like isoform X2 n=1 Tax=Amphiura filiformis TaxID=82378 RepID=UPI003B219EBF
MSDIDCSLYQKCKELAGELDACTMLMYIILVAVVILLAYIYIPKVYPVFFAMMCTYCNNKFAHYAVDAKEELFSDMSELRESLKTENLTILEIGAGSGTNFKYFPSGSSVIALEPNPHFQKYLKRNASAFPGVEIKQIVTDWAEKMTQIGDNSVHAVVCTVVLCSVKDVDAVLSETLRVLKPGGRFYYLEHIYCEEECFTQRMQRLINPIQVRFSDNCHLTRTVADNIDSAGFSEVQYRKFWARKMPRALFIMKSQMLGTATK